MNENLVGYVLNSLDPESRKEVEAYLAADPDGPRYLEMIQQALNPLAADGDPLEPAAGLWVRTIARIAEHQCRPLPVAPPPARRNYGSAATWWRRPDVVVAAGIFLCVALLIPPGVSYLHYRHNKTGCENNLRAFHSVFASYSDRHQGTLPDVTTHGAPRDVAGMYVPIMNDDGAFDGKDVKVNCPGRGQRGPGNWTVQQLKDMDAEQFGQVAPQLGGCYAFNIGYRDADGYHPARLNPDDELAFYPILADRPPFQVATGVMDNSPNHGGRGQNVLFADGHREFRTNRTLGPEGDDIYLSHRKKVEAGTHRHDHVLGSSGSRP